MRLGVIRRPGGLARRGRSFQVSLSKLVRADCYKCYVCYICLPASKEATVAVDAWGAGGGQAEAAVVRFPAEVDISCTAEIAAEMLAAFASGAPVVIADMIATTFCDASGVGVLAKARRMAGEKGKELRIAAAAPLVLKVLEGSWSRVMPVCLSVGISLPSGSHGPGISRAIDLDHVQPACLSQ